MKRIAARLLVLSAALASCPSAWGTWSGFISTGIGTGVGNPSCAMVASDRVVCAVRSGKSALMVNEFNGTAWGAGKNLVGVVESDPRCTSNGSGDVICAAMATSGDLPASVFNGSTWSTPTQVTAQLYSVPSCAELTAGRRTQR